MAGTESSGINRYPPAKPAADLPPRHLIGEYSHKSQVVTCECGWVGSSASPDGQPSDWKRHGAASKVAKA